MVAERAPGINPPPVISVMLPCYNEEVSVGRVIDDCRKYLPEAVIYVLDNNSTDQSVAVARAHGATVIREKRQGKGFVVQAMFSKIESDIYVVVDADATYDLSAVKTMVELVHTDAADMVVGNRMHTVSAQSFRPFHVSGNHLVRFLINRLFGCNLTDIMSGFRVMNRDFVKNINLISGGYEVETEMTIKSLKFGYIIKEVNCAYSQRIAGSHSKLNTFSDGALVLKTIFSICKDYKPLLFFSSVSTFFLLASLASGSVVISEFISTRYITHVPLAIFASGSMVLAIISLVTGVTLDSANRRFDEIYFLIKNCRDR
ncbi:MAG: glycosyltransferase family 2 protein [Desulfobulbaceae bacterium]|nr:glycosyltransferase family 2 protein [Desulfobulbaceae bacterium]